MTRLSPKQIAQVAAGAGFTGAGLTRAVAVALAESGGETRAVGVNSDSHRSRDRGLWQINSYWHREVSDAVAFDPAGAAKAAYRISNRGRDWSQWSTWPAAAAAQTAQARIGVAQAKGTATPAGFLDGLGGLAGSQYDAATEGVRTAKQALVLAVRAGMWMSDSHNWARVGMVVGGATAVLLSVGLLAKSGAIGSTAQTAAAIPGKAAKTAAGAAATVGTGGTAAVAKVGTTAAKAGGAAAKTAKAATAAK